jgi:hypothetical protein
MKKLLKSISMIMLCLTLVLGMGIMQKATSVKADMYFGDGEQMGSYGGYVLSTAYAGTFDKYTLAIQKFLVRMHEASGLSGYYPGTADGYYGEKTKAAVLYFQQRHSPLAQDGQVGSATWTRMYNH